jgi:hypothetical protein
MPGRKRAVARLQLLGATQGPRPRDRRAPVKQAPGQAPGTGVDIDDFFAVPWLGLHHRHELLLHYRHERLEQAPTAESYGFPSLKDLGIRLRQRLRAANLRKRLTASRQRSTGRTPKHLHDETYWWILAGGIHVPGFEVAAEPSHAKPMRDG